MLSYLAEVPAWYFSLSAPDTLQKPPDQLEEGDEGPPNIHQSTIAEATSRISGHSKTV